MFRHLAAPDVTEKAPGEVVTVADRRSEELLSAGLTALLPGSVVVGEEGVAADAEVLQRLHGDGAGLARRPDRRYGELRGRA